jgi:hypothetical protein
MQNEEQIETNVGSIFTVPAVNTIQDKQITWKIEYKDTPHPC